MRAATFQFRLIWLSFVVATVGNACNKIDNCVNCKNDHGTQRCTQCNYGYYIDGDICSSCQSNCVSCMSWNNCTGCVAGYHGNWCSASCDTNCSLSAVCEQYSGTCVHGCRYGYVQSAYQCLRCMDFIQNCDECSDIYHCTKCTFGYNLWPSDGAAFCNVGCPPGTWGVQCQYSCPSNCSNTSCNESSGICYSCTRYTYGQTCLYQCTEGCNDGISNVCDRQTGQCVYGCKQGYTGASCETSLTVTGSWSQWSEYEPCSVTCGFGTKSRIRSCDNPAPQNGGQHCNGSNVEATDCHMYNCSGSNLTKAVTGGQWGQWSNYTSCSATCGGGSRSRSRSCDEPAPQNGGHNCNGSSMDKEDCNIFNCSDDVGKTGANSESGTSSAVVGGAAGGGVLFLIVVVALAVIFVIRKRKQKPQKNKKSETVFYENDRPATATEHGFKNNSYNAVLDVDSSRKELDNHQEDYIYAQPNKPKKDTIEESVNNQNEECLYSVPHKDRNKNGIAKKKEKSQLKSVQEVLQTPPVPCKWLQNMEDDDLEEINESNISEMDSTDGRIPEQNDAYYNTAGLIRRRIPVEKLANTVAEKSEDEFLKEYQRLTDGLSRDYTAAVMSENKYRNRYKKVFPYDATRVRLAGRTSDYINASHVDGYQQNKAYIACLGPTETTMDHFALFWTMVWQQKVEKIVMLTRLMEGEKMKCEQYWPESDSKTYGDITVYRISEVNYAEFSIRNFDVVKDSERRRVCQIHYIAWPDRGVPDDVTSLLEFRHKVVAIPTVSNGPTIVHCSAGIGRTGTYIALDMLIREGSAEKSVDVFGCVNGIRGQRINLVQNVDQYKFLHHALVHELTLSSQLMSPENLEWFVTEEGRTDLRRQFEQLKTVIERTPDMEAESSMRNRDFKTKNRKGADVPGDRHRVKLSSKKPGSTDYINATFVDGYVKVKQFIVAQTPLPATIVDFVGLIMQENIACIVSMDPDLTQDKTAGIYLPPANQTMKIGIYTINCTKSESFANYVMRTLEVSKRQGREVEKKVVYHFQSTFWPNNEPVPTDPVNVVRMVSEVEQTAAKVGGNGGILIHCMDAAERSGLICIVALLIQKLSYEQKISVLNTVRHFRSKRHLAIPTVDQYIFCHKCVVAYQASTDNTYTNVNWRA